MGNDIQTLHAESQSPRNVDIAKLADYHVSGVYQAWQRIQLSGSANQSHFTAKKLIGYLPFPPENLCTITNSFDYKGDGSVAWRDCLCGIAFYTQGKPSEKLQLFNDLIGSKSSKLNHEDLRRLLNHVAQNLERLIIGSKKPYQQDVCDVPLESSDAIHDIVSQLYPNGGQSGDRSLEDIQHWADSNDNYISEILDMNPHSRDKRGPAGPPSPRSSTRRRSSGAGAVSYTWSDMTHPEHNPLVAPPTRCRHASCVYGGAIYMCGGRNGGLTFRDLWRYQLDCGKWERMSCSGEPPLSLQDHTMVGYQGRLFVFGGQFSCSTDRDSPLWILDIDKLHWRKHHIASEVATPGGRRDHVAVVCHGALYIYGGYVDLKGSSSELWIFDLEQQMWHLLYSHMLYDDGPGARHGHSAVVYDNAMWVFGGMTDLQTNNDLWRWDFVCSQWSRVRTRHGPPAMKGHSACRVEDTMLVYGGSSQGQSHNDVWAFHFATGVWSKLSISGLPPMPCVRHTAVVVMVTTSSRSKSAPHLGEAAAERGLRPSGVSRVNRVRPTSSPATMTTTRGEKQDLSPRLFNNKVLPVTSLERSGACDVTGSDVCGAVASCDDLVDVAGSLGGGDWNAAGGAADGGLSCDEVSYSCNSTGADIMSFKWGRSGVSRTGAHGHEPDLDGDSDPQLGGASLQGGAAAQQVASRGARFCHPDWVSTGSLLSDRSDEVPLLKSRRSHTLESVSGASSGDGLDNHAAVKGGSDGGVCGGGSGSPLRLPPQAAITLAIAEDHVPSKRNRIDSDSGDNARRPLLRTKSISMDSILSAGDSGPAPRRDGRHAAAGASGQQAVADLAVQSVSLDSLVTGLGGFQVSCNAHDRDFRRMRSRSVSRDDLILEDIEDTEMVELSSPSLPRAATGSPYGSGHSDCLLDVSTTSESCPLLPVTESGKVAARKGKLKRMAAAFEPSSAAAGDSRPSRSRHAPREGGHHVAIRVPATTGTGPVLPSSAATPEEETSFILCSNPTLVDSEDDPPGYDSSCSTSAAHSSYSDASDAEQCSLLPKYSEATSDMTSSHRPRPIAAWGSTKARDRLPLPARNVAPPKYDKLYSVSGHGEDKPTVNLPPVYRAESVTKAAPSGEYKRKPLVGANGEKEDAAPLEIEMTTFRGRAHNEAANQQEALPEQRVYNMYVLGGQTVEAASFEPRPVSFWRLDVSVGFDPTTGRTK